VWERIKMLDLLFAYYLSLQYPTQYPTYVPVKETRSWEGTASYYSESGCIGCSPNLTMANGEGFDEDALTIAFNKLPLGSLVRVTNIANEQEVTVEVTDRGGFEALGRIADLSKGVKEVINCSDLCEVRVEEL